MSKGRPRDPSTQYRVRPHAVGKYVYAVIRRYVADEATGKIHRKTVQLGRVDDSNTFIPNNTYILLPPEERKKLLFPQEWDLSEVHKLPSERGPGRPACPGTAMDRLYGAVWLLEQIAGQLDVTKDLVTVFNGNREKALDVLTLAIYLFVTGEALCHVAEWQELEYYPAAHPLKPAAVTRLLQSITEEDRVRFTQLRTKRLGKESLCAMDSTTRTAQGNRLPDAAVGKSKDGGYKRQTTEVVVYGLNNHEPIFYQTFPGNVPDSKTLPVILKNLHQAGYKDLILITDRGYESERGIEECILRHQKLITAANVTRGRVLDEIRALGDFSSVPDDMEWIPEEEVFCRQYALEMEVRGRGGKSVKADRMKLNLYYDPVGRAKALVEIQNDLAEQKAGIEKCMQESIPVAAGECSLYRYCHLVFDDDGNVLSFEVDADELRRKQETAGFFANITLGIDYSPQRALSAYGLRDEQEKYFTDMKTRIDCDMQRNSSEKARRGARFVEFISLILISWVKHTWALSEKLRAAFPTVRSMILAMRRIHRFDRAGKEKTVTIYLEKQMLVCEQFGIDVPAECRSKYTSREVKPSKKRGRSKKSDTTPDTQ